MSADPRTRILEFAFKEFTQHGFNKYSMDELASNLKMSKKTIYSFFPTKEDLIREAVHSFFEMNAAIIKSFLEQDSSAVSKFIAVISHFSKVMQTFSNKWVHDLQVLTPELWSDIEKRRRLIISNVIAVLWKQGIEEGTFKPYPMEIVLQVYLSALNAVVNPGFISTLPYSVNEAFQIVTEILTNGFATEKGNKQIKKFIKGNNV